MNLRYYVEVRYFTKWCSITEQEIREELVSSPVLQYFCEKTNQWLNVPTVEVGKKLYE